MINSKQKPSSYPLISHSQLKQIIMQPVGFVSSQIASQTDENWGETSARIDLLDEYAGGLSGLADFSHAIIVTYLHQAKFESIKGLQRHPREREDMPEVGIFAQRAKDRPNPIGITVVEIMSARESYLEVRGLDAIDGTPVLDIKPYYPIFDNVDSPKVPEWVDRLMENYF